MAGQRGFDGDVQRVGVADFADHDDVGIVAQQAAQRLGEAHFFSRIDFDLRDAGEFVFDRVFDGDDVQRAVLQQALNGGIECGGLAAAGRAGEQQQTVRLIEDVFHTAQMAVEHAQVFERKRPGLQSEQTQRHAFAELRRQRRGADIDAARVFERAAFVREAAVLRRAFFGDIHPGAHFQTADQARFDAGRKRVKLLKLPVDAEAHAQGVAARLDVDVRRTADNGGVQNFFGQRHGVVAGIEGARTGALAGRGRRAACAGTRRVGVNACQGALQGFAFGGSGERLLPGEAFHGFEGAGVVGIGAGDVHASVEMRERQDHAAQRQCGRDLQRPRGIDAHEVHVEQGNGVAHRAASFENCGAVRPRLRCKATRSRKACGLREMAIAAASVMRPSTSSRVRS